MRTRNLAFTAVIGACLAAATIFQATALCTGTAKPTAMASSAAAVPGIAAEGRVVAYPGAEVRVAAERGGRVVRVLVDEGTTVKRGDLIAELESAELRAGLDEARARLAEADAETRLAELNEGRRRELVAQRVVAVHDLDQATRDVEITRARRDTVRAEITRLEAQLRKTRIVAPISGTVVGRDVDPGEMLEASDVVVTLADLTRLRVEGEADEADAGALAPGALVEINAYGYPGRTWQGRIEEVADSVTVRRVKPQDPARPTDTRVITVKVAFAEPNPLKLGTTVELAIHRPAGL
jgi:HlyD family secretion protein